MLLFRNAQFQSNTGATAMTNLRQDKILDYLKVNRSATVKELSGALYASEATIRRDLMEMQSVGVLKRSRGGAVLMEHADEIAISVRMTENIREKELVATNALPLIPTEYNTVYLDSSSTVYALALRMQLAGKTVVCNNLQTVMQLAKNHDINLIVPGGNISKTGVSISGSWTNTLLAEFHFDLMLTSCAAIMGTDCYETSLDQREIKRIVFEQSDKRILLVDHTKFEQKGNYIFSPLKAFDQIVLDALPMERAEQLKGLPVIV